MNQYPQRGIRTRDWKYIRNLNPDAEYHSHVDKAPGRDKYFPSWLEKANTDPAAAEIVHAYYKRPAEELYDLSADPDETHNLAADPAHAATLARLRADLDAWMTANDDKGMATERGLLATPPRPAKPTAQAEPD